MTHPNRASDIKPIVSGQGTLTPPEPHPFPNDDALVKLLWLGIVDIEERRADERARQAGKPKSRQNAAGHLIEGAVTQGWREALAAFDAKWPGRIPDWAV